MVHDVFISHSSKDKAIADAVCAALEASKIRCWIAPRDIIPGEKWASAITKAISGSRIMLLIFSSHSNNSDDVLNELLLARDAGAIIIPLKIGDILPNGDMEYYLKRTHWLDAMDPPTEIQIQKLVETVCSFIKGEGADRKEHKDVADRVGSAQSAPGIGEKKRSIPLQENSSSFSKGLIGIAAILGILIIGIWIMTSGSNDMSKSIPSPTLTVTPTSIPHQVTPTSASTVSPLSTIRPATQPITIANAGSVAQVRWAKIFGSPVNLALSPDGKTLAVASAFNILVYDLGNLEAPLFELEGQKTLSRVMFTPDGQILASAGSSFDGNIWLWDMPMGGVKRAVLEGHSEGIYSISFSPNGELLASGSRDNSVRVWDVKTGKELFFSQEHNREVHSVAFSTDGATLASGGADGKIRIWDVKSSQAETVLDAHRIQVDCLAFSPDGKLLASAGQYDTAIRLWDTQTWQPTIILRGHVESGGGYGVFSLAFNDKGTLLASGGGDKSIRLWDVNPVSPSFGKELVALQRHSDWVDSLVFSLDGVTLISASKRDGTIRIWEVSPES